MIYGIVSICGTKTIVSLEKQWEKNKQTHYMASFFCGGWCLFNVRCASSFSQTAPYANEDTNKSDMMRTLVSFYRKRWNQKRDIDIWNYIWINPLFYLARHTWLLFIHIHTHRWATNDFDISQFESRGWWQSTVNSSTMWIVEKFPIPWVFSIWLIVYVCDRHVLGAVDGVPSIDQS